MIRILATLLFLCHSVAHADELRRSGFFGIAAAAPPAGAQGVLVRDLVDGGSAKEAGVQRDDLIQRVDGRNVVDAAGFVAMARALRAGDVASVDLIRAGREVTVRVPVKPRPYEKAPGLEIAYDSVAVSDHLRRTLLTLPPQASGRLPAVLFVTGIGCFSQELADPEDGVARLLHGLTRSGFVTMRVEKSGAGDSQGPSCNSPEADLRSEVAGYVAGLRALKKHPRVDPDNVFIVGLSLGGVEAPLIEQQEPVRGVVAINTAAKPFFEYLLDTRRRQLTMRKTPFDQVDRDMARCIRCNHAVLLDRQTPDEVLRRMPECREDIQFPAPYTLMQQWAALNMAEAWKKTQAPLLVVIGASDWVASVAESPYLVDMVNSFKPGRARLEVIPGMDHWLSKAPTMQASMDRGGAPGEFEPAVLEATARWLRGQAAG
jgi:pimeloyl-ACP methyl ester carboxylesterase